MIGKIIYYISILNYENYTCASESFQVSLNFKSNRVALDRIFQGSFLLFDM